MAGWDGFEGLSVGEVVVLADRLPVLWYRNGRQLPFSGTPLARARTGTL